MTRLILVAAVLLFPVLAQAQESKSTPIVGELLKMLDQMKVDSVAAAHGDGFVGAFYVPGQLLLVRGKFASTERAGILIERKMYRDLYGDLNSAAELATKVFISDLGADGLKFRRQNNNQPFDTADVGDKSYRFDGDWGKQKLSRDEYTRVYQSTDEQYMQMVQALIDQLKKP
ncbi:MAG: hypothetical protein ABL986_17540 [Vicinamibacterales bacterium]